MKQCSVTKIRLEITSKADYNSLVEFLRVQQFLTRLKPECYKEYAYRGVNWEVTVRVLPDGRSYLRIKDGMEEKDGVASYHLVVSEPVAHHGVAAAFHRGLDEGRSAVCGYFQQHNSDVLPDVEAAFDAVSHWCDVLDDQAVYHEVEVHQWNCNGKDTLNFGFSLREVVGVLPEGDEMSSYSSASSRRGAQYWLSASCGLWGTPSSMMEEMQRILNVLGIRATRHTVQKAAERVEDKKDIKIRISSSYGYEEFLREAPTLMRSSKSTRAMASLRHVDYYYDTAERGLSQAQCTLRFRRIKKDDEESSTFELTLQSSISVLRGQQKRNLASLSLSPSVATNIEAKPFLLLEDLGREGELWRSHLEGLTRNAPLVRVAGFSTRRHQIPWLSSCAQPIQQTTRITPTQFTHTIRSPPLVNLDHMEYGHLEPRFRNVSGEVVSPSLHLYEVEVTNIEDCGLQSVMSEMVRFLDCINVEWQLSVNNKLQQFFELKEFCSRLPYSATFQPSKRHRPQQSEEIRRVN